MIVLCTAKKSKHLKVYTAFQKKKETHYSKIKKICLDLLNIKYKIFQF